MADAKRCDLCGAFYEAYRVFGGFVDFNEIVTRRSDAGCLIVRNCYELCPKCAADLTTVIRGMQKRGTSHEQEN